MSKGIIVKDVPNSCMSCECRICFDGESYCGATGHKLDVEYHLNFGCVYYSTDKEKCMEWLKNKYKQERDKIITLYNAISETQIIDKGVEIL